MRGSEEALRSLLGRRNRALYNPLYEEVASFFRGVIDLREKHLGMLRQVVDPAEVDVDLIAARLASGKPFIERAGFSPDVSIVKPYFLELADYFEQRAPGEIDAACDIAEDEELFERLIRDAAKGDRALEDYPYLIAFLAREAVSPVLELHAAFLSGRPELDGWWRGDCPGCGDMPLVGVIGDMGKKSLVCRTCRLWWPFPRMGCPFCGKQDQGCMEVLTAEGEERLRVEACSSCNTYLKVFDLRSGFADFSPELADISTLHLDMIARDRGYTSPNISFLNS